MIVGCTTPKDSVVGTYAGLWGNIPSKLIFHDEGIIELANDSMFGKWTMVGKDKEVEVDLQRNGEVSIFRINPDGSITKVGYLTKEGKRINWEGLTSSRTFRKKE